jgi:signal recognition particle receptor subunit beta
MAFLDDNGDAVVLRLVYAGPPMAGKTETVRALSRLLPGIQRTDAVYSPGEASERTLFFDWLDYSGGFFQGRRIRCQIVSVPGQNLLYRRRRALLLTADAVVFVVDAHAEHKDTITRSYRELRRVIATSGREVPVGIVVQANKSDLPHAMGKEELLQLLGDSPNMIVIPSIATQGTGVREAFVRAVGLGLARAHAQMANGTLDAPETAIRSGEALLKALMEMEEAQYGKVAASARRDAAVDVSIDAGRDHFEPEKIGAILKHRADRQSPAHELSQESATPEQAPAHPSPAPPDDRLDSGMVWPPIAGRVILHEITASPPVVSQLESLSWTAQAGERWQLLSLPQHCFPSQAAAREELLRLARMHAQFRPLLSEHRCLCGAPSGLGDWRIWQVVRRETTLADILRLTLGLKSPDSVAAELLRIARMLCKAAELFQNAGLPFTPSLETLAVSHRKPVFTRYLLPDAAEPQATHARQEPAQLLRAQLHDAVAKLAQRRESAPSLLRQFEAARENARAGDIVPETLIAMFIQHG